MRRISMTVAAALAALLVTGGMVGCKKDGGSAGGAEKGKPAGAAASALDVMPATTAGLGGLNVKKLVASKLWKEYGTKLLNEGEVKSNLEKLKAGCGFDPAADIDSVVMGADGNMEESSLVVIIKGNFNADKMIKCATVAAEGEGKKVTGKTEGKITTLTAEGEDKSLYIGWIADDTMLVVPEAIDKGDKALLEKILAGGTSAKSNAALSALMGNVNTGETVWAAADLSQAPKAGEAFEQLGAKPAGMWINLGYQTDLSMEVGLRFASADEAKKVTEMMDKQLKEGLQQASAMLGDMSNAGKVEAKGNDCVITIKLTGEQIDKVIGMVGPMLGGMLPGM